jgi:hypothetical protein
MNMPEPDTPRESRHEHGARHVDGEVELDSVTLKRLLAEVRNEEVFEPASYNRLHNRHNRTR